MDSSLTLGDNLINKVFFDKYKLVEKLGEGTFGMIFKCESSDGLCAFKFEKKRPNKRSLLKSESQIMEYLKGPGIPKIMLYVEEDDFNIMIMELLGKSLEGLLKESPEKKFSVKSVCMLGIEMVKILEYIHNKHFIHRDVKPDNFAIGYSDQSSIYLLDFGLAKKYRSSKTLEQKPMSKNNKLTGTARYASINALMGYDQSRRDDLESVGYVLAYLLRGSLPWQGILAKTKDEKYSKILYKKQYITPEQLFEGFPNGFNDYIKYCRKLKYEEEPNYKNLKNILSNIIKNDLKEEIDYKYDWIINDIDLSRSIKENYISNDNDTYKKEDNKINNKKGHYDKIIEENGLNKDNKIKEDNEEEDEEEEKDDFNNHLKKRNHDACCILY